MKVANDGLCRVGHPLDLEGRCPKCAAKPDDTPRCKNGHDLSLPDATFEEQGSTKCRECKKARRRRSKLKARIREIEARAQTAEEEALAEKARAEALPTIAVPPRPNGALGREAQARHRHALLVRKQRGLLP